MRYYFDTEFMEDGKRIELISIGIVAEDGREIYLGNINADLNRANDWVKVNVLPHVPAWNAAAADRRVTTGNHDLRFWQTPEVISDRIRDFINPESKRPIEIWAYYADYDWVLFCQLFGAMSKLPSWFPMMAMDLMQLAIDMRICRPGESLKDHVPQPDGEHDALEDARWNKRAHEWLRRQGYRGT